MHDISSSGSTVFIEPISVFELNNEIANLKIEESLEIEKILQNLSKLFYPYVEEIKKDIECILNMLKNEEMYLILILYLAQYFFVFFLYLLILLKLYHQWYVHLLYNLISFQ